MSEKYNPSDVGVKGTIFGLPYSVEESDLVFIPVNIDVTTSYEDGTSEAPNKILEESSQLDLSSVSIEQPWMLKMAFDENVFVGVEENNKYRKLAKEVIEKAEAGEDVSNHPNLELVNNFCEKVKQSVYTNASSYLNQGKIVGIIGGDHSSPLGLIQALSEKNEFSILQIDAHMDLRNAYGGFKYSHASIMKNALQLEGVKSLTQVGIRDFCQEEELFVRDSSKAIISFYDEEIYWDYMQGKRWVDICDEIVSTLNSMVYISFDIDGLEPSHCPNTGTPVVGGLSFNQAIFLINRVVRSGRKIIGFDLCETGNASWDANVAARVLFNLSSYTGVSNKLLNFR